jgi:hypothetical protein
MANEARRAAMAASSGVLFEIAREIAKAIPAKAARTVACLPWCSDFEVRTHAPRHLLRTSKLKGAPANYILPVQRI